MSYIITASDLEGLTEQQLRAKRQAILSDLARCGLTLEEAPLIAASLHIIDEAIARHRFAPRPRF